VKIAILDDYQDVVRTLDCFGTLRDHDVRVFTETWKDVDELAVRLAEFEALVLIRERTRITPELLEKLPNLKLISQTGKVSNHLNADECQRYGVAVAEGVGSPVAPAELCWGLIMAASRQIPSYVANLKADSWQQSAMGLGRTLNGLTLGIWGYGKIGKRIAQFGKVFGMHVLVWGREPSRQQACEDGFAAAESQAEFFATADILSLHLRLNAATRGCVTRSDLARMKPDALFVNTSRAELVTGNALYEELAASPTKSAAVDVYREEPATCENEPLLALPNVLCSPHLGYVERNSYELYFGMAFENVVAFAKGEPQNLVAVTP